MLFLKKNQEGVRNKVSVGAVGCKGSVFKNRLAGYESKPLKHRGTEDTEEITIVKTLTLLAICLPLLPLCFKGFTLITPQIISASISRLETSFVSGCRKAATENRAPGAISGGSSLNSVSSGVRRTLAPKYSGKTTLSRAPQQM